jgi:hypothetical protein
VLAAQLAAQELPSAYAMQTAADGQAVAVLQSAVQ